MCDRLIELLKEAFEQCKGKACEDCVGYGRGEDCIHQMVAYHLLANGVIVPPVKVGQTVYGIFYPGTIEPISVVEICIGEDDILILSDTNGEDTFFAPPDIGKTVFLTREEAEQALKGGEKE